MATPDAPPATAPAAAPAVGGLRIVLFGLPGAGKSSLLGALAQAAQSQEHLLNGRLLDLSHHLDELRVRLYDASPQPTAEEVVPYPIAFEPFNDAGATAEPVRAVVLDCDGRVANDLIANPEALENGVPPRPLAAQVLGADALILPVDASAPPDRLEADFTAFDHFLREMELGRSSRTEVGGLPVFLVLTKCDLLAHPGDTTVDWIERIEQRKREVDAHFREFLSESGAVGGHLPFGDLDLQLWATAVKRPALASAPARPREPYGVAELFRQCLDLALAHRRRVRRSGRRLVWTVSGAGAVLASMLMLALFLVLRPGARPPSELQQRVEQLQLTEGHTPADRLRAPLPELRRRRENLRLIQTHPEFGALPQDEREFVDSRHAELDKYIGWYEQVQVVPRPAGVDTEAELREVKEQLEKVGGSRDPDWDDTPAARLYQDQLNEATALLDGVEHVKAAYLGDPKAAVRLWSFEGYRHEGGGAGIDWRRWQEDLSELPRLDPEAFKQTKALPGAPNLTYAAVMRIDTVLDASTLRQRLVRVRDLSAALGLVVVPDRPPVLVIERPPAFKLADARGRLKELQGRYPDYKTEKDREAFEAFVRGGLPDALLRVVDRAVATNYDNLLEPARALVLSQLRKAGEGDEETPARWHPVRDWLLRDPEELSAWRELAMALLRLRDPHPADPVTALATFLQETTFSLAPKRITLELPDSLRARVTSSAALSIYHLRTSEKRPTLVFEQDGEPKRDADRRVTVYTFHLRKGDRIVYLPGDDLWVTLPLPDNMQLTWQRNRSTTYQFERLFRAPRLHKAEEDPAKGELVEDVRVIVSPPEGWPRVPDLLPVVRLAR
jgi:hypothetical protein